MGRQLLEVLGRVSGLGEPEAHRIWERVKANSAKLESCSRHEFEPIEDDRRIRSQRCSKCGGEVGGSEALWYKRGLQHGGG